MSTVGEGESVSGDKAIAATADGYDVDGLLAVFFYLAAQAVDVNHDCIIIDSDIGSPDLLVNDILGVDLAGVLQKQQQQSRLPGRENQLAVIL